MGAFTYRHEKTKEISFPLGGIGSGSVGLSGNGRFIDWEIFNRPNKQSENGFTHFAIKAEADGELIDARVLNGDLLPPYTGNIQTRKHGGFGFGPNRAAMTGVPHFEDLTFIGEFPIATLQFHDRMFPATVTMTAFNPFIPLNDQDSSIPGAFFELEIENTSDKVITYTTSFSLENPHKDPTRNNRYKKVGKVHAITLSSDNYDSNDPRFGDLTIGTDSPDISYQEYWYRGSWFDNLETFWNDFTAPGPFQNRNYESNGANVKTLRGEDVCTLAAHFELKPGEKGTVRYILTWNYPNCQNYWNPEESNCCDDDTNCCPVSDTWKNYYSALFSNSLGSASYGLNEWDRLYRDTIRFKEALFSSTVPEAALEAISANISILKSPTCLRLTDGSFYGFEGCICNEGCCEGSCTHVWNYAYALPFLFPKLERSMRDLEYRYNLREDGKMSFRLMLPLGRKAWDFRACVDGQFGGVIKTYREWKISGDTEWLKSKWPAVKKSIEFAWSETNEDKWDANKDGVLEGRQHHTLDMELFGPNAWLNGFYLAALKAGAEMADFLGEAETAGEYRELFEKGKKWTDDHLFNGQYYNQIIDIHDRSILEAYDESAIRDYWNDEALQIKYQIADGCGIDQVLAQWHANLCGLGEVLDSEQTRTALASIYRNNFKKNMRNFFNPCRIYSLNDEAGLVICDWPKETKKPAIPLTYAQETMNGFEYQAAIHMIQEGLVEEGMEVVKAIRDRYDGERRNPWNEFECGSNYARSMASYALLLTYSGFEYHMAERTIGFNPIESDGNFNFFWSVGSAWGTIERQANHIELKVLYGSLTLQTLKLPFIANNESLSVELDNLAVPHSMADGIFTFPLAVTIDREQTLNLKI